MCPCLLALRGLTSSAAGLAGLAAVGVVGQRHVDLAGEQARLDVLGAVHLGGADLVRGEPGEDEHLLGGHPVDVRDGRR